MEMRYPLYEYRLPVAQFFGSTVPATFITPRTHIVRPVGGERPPHIVSSHLVNGHTRIGLVQTVMSVLSFTYSALDPVSETPPGK